MAKEKKEKKGGKAKWVVLVSVFIVAIAVISGGCSDESTEATTDSSDQQSEQQEKTEFGIGETWTVDGQWTLTVTSVETSDSRNEYSDKNPAAVYVVNYTYTNTGYEDENGLMDGLYLGMEDTIVDAAGTMGYSYPGDITSFAQETPVGATCNAQACIGVDNPGDFKITVTTYDGHGEKQSATFNLTVPA